MRIGHAQSKIAKPFAGFLAWNVMALETRLPVACAFLRYSKASGSYLSTTATTATRTWPWKERHYRAGPPRAIAVVEVVCARIVKVHSALYKSQPENANVEIEIRLRFTRDRRDVMNAAELHYLGQM